MSDEIDKEVTSRKITSNSNSPVDGFRVTEQHTTKARSVDNSGATGLVVVVLSLLAIGAGFTAYYLNNRPNPTIVVPGATNTIKENKTIIERNTTSPAPAPAPAPDINIDIPPAPAPNIDVNVPPPTVVVPKVDVNVAPATPPAQTPPTTFTIPPTTNGQ